MNRSLPASWKIKSEEYSDQDKKADHVNYCTNDAKNIFRCITRKHEEETKYISYVF